MKNVACQKVLMWHNVATSCPAGHKCSTGSIPGQGKLPHNKEEAKKKKKVACHISKQRMLQPSSHPPLEKPPW